MSNKRIVYSDLDKQVFLEILKKYKHVIEAKGTSSSSLKEKSEAWALIMEEYNNSSLISTKRDVQQLRKYWSNLKTLNKNILTAEKQSRFLTGGGPEKEINEEVDPNVLDIVPDLMATAATIASSNFSTLESKDRQREVFKAVRQNSFTKIDFITEDSQTQKLLSTCDELISDSKNKKRNDNLEASFKIDDTSFLKESSNESDIYIVEQENKENSLHFGKSKHTNTKSISATPKRQKTDRITLVCEKEMELADIKINHEIEMCKLKKEREEFINRITIEKLLLEKKELQERVKLAKFRAQKEMEGYYVPDNEQE